MFVTSFLAFLFAFSVRYHPAPEVAHTQPFVARFHNRLVLDGKPFRFAGANIYWLGLDENVEGIQYPTHFRVDDALDTAKAMGANVVRSQTLGVSTGNSSSVEPALGQFNNNGFESMDYAIAAAKKRGIRLIIPLTDNYNYYHGGKHNFTDWLDESESDFYTDPNAITAYETYIYHVLNHRNPYTGLKYKDDPTILAWELGNELSSPPKSWTETIANYIKTQDTHHLVSDSVEARIDRASLSVPSIDMYDEHEYPLDISQVKQDAKTVSKAGKIYYIGEYDWTHLRSPQVSAISGDKDIGGALFWSLFAHTDTYGYEQHSDGYTLHFPGDTPTMKAEVKQVISLDQKMTRIGRLDWTPGQPRITMLSTDKIAWRGTAVAATYQVQTSTSEQGPWTTLNFPGVTDLQTPWAIPQGYEKSNSWFRVIAISPNGISGRPSTIVLLK